MAGLRAAAAAGPDDPTRSAVVASNAFGIDLFRTLAAAKPGENLFISPYSMSVALAMTAEGARDETESEMARVLKLPVAAQGERVVTSIHAGHASIAERYRAASGNATPQVRQRIEELRAELDLANKKAQLRSGSDWKAQQDAAERAGKLASELNALLATVDRFDLRIANALWVEKTYALAPNYVQVIAKFYGTGGVYPLDIRAHAEASRLRINGWVEDNTEHRIKNLIPGGVLTPDIRLVITNAVYFKGEWAAPFSEGSTRDEDFTLSSGGTTKVKMMLDSTRSAVPYAAFSGNGDFFPTPLKVPRNEADRPPTYPDEGGFTMIELPYKGGDLTMVAIAPRSPAGLAALEAKLTPEALESWLKQLDRRTVDTGLPRFTLESAREMTPPLQSMGMRRAFLDPAMPGGADFSGMTTSEDPSQKPFIGAVLHKAWVEVNEKGTEAAAATDVMMEATAAMPPHHEDLIPFTPRFRADRPFLFLIRDSKSGLVLFMGKIVKPAAS